ncbi:MAG: hypothetical protein M1814_001891 [Vezdaea aestivalis]|nr:MAG: hypothetical protein M1814_001891 [Vezdaea aestivalis]
MILLWIVLLLFLASSLVSRFKASYNLRHFNGPFSAAWSRFFIIRAAWSGKQYLILQALGERYGKLHSNPVPGAPAYRSSKGNLTRIAPNVLLVTDADTWRYVNGARSIYRKSDQYNVFKFDPRGHHVISETDHTKWKYLRQASAHGFSGKEVDNIEGTVDLVFLKLVDLLRRKSSTFHNPSFIDLARPLHYYTSDFITKIDFGKELGFIEADDDIFHYMEDTSKFFPFLAVCAAWPNLFHFLDHKWVRPLYESKLLPKDRGIGALREWAKKEVKTRFGSGKVDQRDMLGSFIRHGMSQFDAECTALLQVMAGSDTVASQLISAIYFITSNPWIHKKVYDEVSEWKQGKSLDGVISQNEARTLGYTQACIKETLRCAPVISGIIERLVPVGGDTLDGKFVPEGTRVVFDLYGSLRRKEIFGRDAEIFRPERWLERSEEDLAQMKSLVGLVFGVGKIDCMGKAIAYLELEKVVPELIYRFYIMPKDPSHFGAIHHHILAWHEFSASIIERKHGD